MKWEKAYDNRTHVQGYVTVQDVLNRLHLDEFSFPFYADDTLSEVLTFKHYKDNLSQSQFSRPGGGSEGARARGGVSWAHQLIAQRICERGKIVVEMPLHLNNEQRVPVFFHIADASRGVTLDGFVPDVLGKIIDVSPYDAGLIGEIINIEVNLSHAVEAFKRMMLYFNNRVTLEVDWPAGFASRKFTKNGVDAVSGISNRERLMMSFSERRLARWVVAPLPPRTRMVEFSYDDQAADVKAHPMERIRAALIGVATYCKGDTLTLCRALQDPLKAMAHHEKFKVASRIEPAVVTMLRVRQMLKRSLISADDERIVAGFEHLLRTCVKVVSLIEAGIIR